MPALERYQLTSCSAVMRDGPMTGHGARRGTVDGPGARAAASGARTAVGGRQAVDVTARPEVMTSAATRRGDRRAGCIRSRLAIHDPPPSQEVLVCSGADPLTHLTVR